MSETRRECGCGCVCAEHTDLIDDTNALRAEVARLTEALKDVERTITGSEGLHTAITLDIAIIKIRAALSGAMPSCPACGDPVHEIDPAACPLCHDYHGYGMEGQPNPTACHRRADGTWPTRKAGA